MIKNKAIYLIIYFSAFEPTDQFDLYNAFAEAVSTDNTLSEYQGFDFAEYYRIWVNEPGYPILNVDINHSTGLISLRQVNNFRFNLFIYSNENKRIMRILIANTSAELHSS